MTAGISSWGPLAGVGAAGPAGGAAGAPQGPGAPEGPVADRGPWSGAPSEETGSLSTRIRPSSLVGLIIVRGAGFPAVQQRLPRRSTATVGRRERHAVELRPEWVPLDLATFTAVPGGWLVENGARSPLRVENDWVRSGSASYFPRASIMLQRGDHHVTWPGLDGPVAISVTVRTRRLDDGRIRYAVDNRISVSGNPGFGSYLGVQEAPMSAALRYRLAVVFRHLITGEPEPVGLLRRRAEYLGMTEQDLDWTVQRLRRRLNVVRGLDLQTLDELGDYLVHGTAELSRADLDP